MSNRQVESREWNSKADLFFDKIKTCYFEYQLTLWRVLLVRSPRQKLVDCVILRSVQKRTKLVVCLIGVTPLSVRRNSGFNRHLFKFSFFWKSSQSRNLVEMRHTIKCAGGAHVAGDGRHRMRNACVADRARLLRYFVRLDRVDSEASKWDLNHERLKRQRTVVPGIFLQGAMSSKLSPWAWWW